MTLLVHILEKYKQVNNSPVHSTPFYVGQDIIACLVSLQPGAVVPEHVHEHQDEIFDVIEGSGIFVLGEQEIALRPGMTICVPANMRHGLRAGDQPWILRETVHRRVYARQALARALQKRWQKLRRLLPR